MSEVGPATPGGGGGGVAWNDSRANGSGIGLLHTIGASALSGVKQRPVQRVKSS